MSSSRDHEFLGLEILGSAVGCSAVAAGWIRQASLGRWGVEALSAGYGGDAWTFG